MNTGKLSPDYVMQIGRRMIEIHRDSDTVNQAIEIYNKQFPQVDEEVLTLMWFAINCKDREHVDA